jgi:hypothetical protein
MLALIDKGDAEESPATAAESMAVWRLNSDQNINFSHSASKPTSVGPRRSVRSGPTSDHRPIAGSAIDDPEHERHRDAQQKAGHNWEVE